MFKPPPLSVHLLLAAIVATGDVAAQASWELASPTYERVRTTYRQKPQHSEVTSGVLALGQLPPLNGVALPQGDLELRIWVVPVTTPHRLLRIVRQGDQVFGEMFAWWSTEYAVPVDGYLVDLAGRNGCIESSALRGSRPETPQATVVQNGLCLVDYGLESPNWHWVLKSLEAARVEELPHEREVPTVFDGQTLWVDVLQGREFRSYEYHSPSAVRSSEGEDAQRIIELVNAVFPWVGPSRWK